MTPTPRWYELDRLLPYRDLVLVAGIACLLGGVACYTLPGALMLAGAILVALGWLMGRSA
jgi:hypothetical protein